MNIGFTDQEAQDWPDRQNAGELSEEEADQVAGGWDPTGTQDMICPRCQKQTLYGYVTQLPDSITGGTLQYRCKSCGYVSVRMQG